MISFVVQLIKCVLGVAPMKPYASSSGDAIILRSGQPQVFDFFLGYGFPRGRKAGTVRAPERIMGSNGNTVIRGFLRGLFSTDGCFSYQVERGARVEIQVKSVQLRDDFVNLADRLGFSFRTYSYLPPNGKNKAPLQVAYTTKAAQVVRWMEEVGSIKDSHIKRYRVWKELIEG